MKFREIFRFEITYQLRRAWPWLIILMLMSLVFLFMRDGELGEAMYTEFYINSPFMVAMATVFGNLLWLLSAAFIGGEAAASDIYTRIYPLTYTTPITKAQYLGAKFLAALVLNAFILLFVQVTIILAIYLPGVHPDSLGPFRPEAFLTAYFFIAIPNAVAATAIQFAFASRSGRPINAYIGSLLLFFTAFFIASLLLFRSGLGTLLDPIGVRFVWDELSHLWTTYEKSHRLLELKGTLLQNRMVWTGVALLVGTITYLRFEFGHRAASQSWFQRIIRKKTVTESTDNTETPGLNTALSVRPVRDAFTFAFHSRQTVSIAWASFKAIATSWAGLFMLGIIPLLVIPVVIDQVIALGVPLTPTTARVINELTSSMAHDLGRWMIIPGLIVFFVGELVWRERDYNIGEITDTMPGSEWAPVLGKFIGVGMMMVLFTVIQSGAGMVAQMIMGYTNFEIGLYLEIMFGLQLPEYLLFAALALFVHSLANQKYVGHLIAIIAYAFIAGLASMFGIEHNLLIYSASPGWSYNEMRGFGLSLKPWIWFKLYWAAWALLLTVVAVLFWPRGKENNLKVRLKLARRHFKGFNAWIAYAAGFFIATLGGFIFFNTHLLYGYFNSETIKESRADYEHHYSRYENVPQPKIKRVKLQMEIFSKRQAVEIDGSYTLVNNTGVAIDSIHLSTPTGTSANISSMSFDQKATMVVNDWKRRYRIYKLESPLLPGDSLQLNFGVKVVFVGFGNNGIDPSIVEGGSFFSNDRWFPSIGYQRMRGIINPAERKKYGLEPRPLLASLSEAHDGEFISMDEGVEFEAEIGTDEGQVAVAPGNVKRTWQEHGRNYFHYVTSAPIGSEWDFFSANYEVFEKEWVSKNGNHKPVTVRIFHYPKHTAHLERMMRGAVNSLEYYTEQFGPYPYTHLTIVENPIGPGTGMHAEASLIYHGQGYAQWAPQHENDFDLPYGIMGHEMGHQWSLPLSFVEGLPFMAEGLAWYYSMMQVKSVRGPVQERKLMSFMRQPYPHQPIRRGEPLLRALDPYLAYKRGPLAMYALTEYMGVDRVNKALRILNEKTDTVGASPVSTLDLYRELRALAPDSVQTLLHDLFEVNTLWQFETSKFSAVKNGELWTLTLDVKATKIVYDSAGVVTEVPMDEWIPIGVFAQRKPNEDELSAPLYLKKHRITSGEQQITLTVSGQPVLAGIDPHHVLDWEEKDDDNNIEGIATKVE